MTCCMCGKEIKSDHYIEMSIEFGLEFCSKECEIESYKNKLEKYKNSSLRRNQEYGRHLEKCIKENLIPLPYNIYFA